MLQKAFFKVDVVDRIYDTPVFEKTTPGAYEFTIPDGYNYVVIEYAGAGGGRAWNSDGAGIYPFGVGGSGSILKTQIKITHNKNISGIVGAKPIQTYEQEYLGGTGYSSGENSNKYSVTIKYISGGGGGGSTSVIANDTTYEASAGGGASNLTKLAPKTYGGRGGGTYGGARQNGAGEYGNANGLDATDPNQIGLNSGNGYVKIWAGYDPYFKG